ncbi:MAG: TetR/AcrR family transcriptional regulator [Actinobacteria bacterium]|nr:TetR/AcrR family transcriptional regulator [Actinomycetota bacterium]
MYLGPGPRGYVVRSSRDCSLAGVGRATIYVHFPTGQSLAAAVTERFEATV